MLNVLLDATPLTTGHAIRGVGMYTRFLLDALDRKRALNVYASAADVPRTEILDVIHYPFFDLFFDTLPLRKSVPTVVTIHDVIPLLFPEYYPVGSKGRIRFLKQLLSLRKVAAVITDSEVSKADISQHLKVPERKITVVPLAPNPALAPATKQRAAAVKAQYNLPDRYILYVGDINYNKNIPQLIKLLKFLPDEFHLVCVGKNFYPHDIPEWQWIDTQLALSNVTNRVQFLTELGVDDANSLAAVYSLAEAYVQPSLYEGFGLPILEAMRCRVPVVAAKTSSIPEVAGDWAILTEPTAEALAEGVKEALSWSQAKRQRWLKAAEAWSHTFTWEKTATATLKVYQSVTRTQ